MHKRITSIQKNIEGTYQKCRNVYGWESVQYVYKNCIRGLEVLKKSAESVLNECIRSVKRL